MRAQRNRHLRPFWGRAGMTDNRHHVRYPPCPRPFPPMPSSAEMVT
jgi:hypothetical protein